MFYSISHNALRFSRVLAASVLTSLFLFAGFSPIRAEELLQPTAAEYRVQGYAAQQKGNLDQALSFYLKALAMGEHTAAIYNDIGVVYEELGVYDQAEVNYKQAIAENPDYLPAYSNLAYMYKEQGDSQQALLYFKERYERCADDDPKREKFRAEILALDPTYKDRIIRAELETTRQALQAKAKAEFDQDVARAERHYAQGQQYAQAKDFEKALIEFDRALNLTPNNPKLIRAKNDTLYQQRIEEVRKRVNEAMKQLDAGQVDAARSEFQNILTIIPSEPVQKSEE